MLSFFKSRANKRRHENELAELRIMLDAINKLFAAEELPEHNKLFMVKVGSQIRKALEHRFSWARETEIDDDQDLRTEEKRIDALSVTDLEDLVMKVTDAADKSGTNEELPETVAMRLLSGWLKSKLIVKKSVDRAVVNDAREHEDLHLFHVRNLLRIVRGEKSLP